MSRDDWHPRGEQTWPEWKSAVPGVTRVQHVRSGAQGTFKQWPVTHRGNPGHATILWDNGFTGRVVAYAFDLKEIHPPEAT